MHKIEDPYMDLIYFLFTLAALFIVVAVVAMGRL